MAGLASKLSPLLPGVSNSLTGSAKLLAVQAVVSKESRASIYSKTSGQLETRMKPWNYNRWGYNFAYQFLDGTTKRFNDNSKVIVIEGPPGLEKTKLAKELADEFDMLYVPCVTMDDLYINLYGYDLRELDHHFHHQKNKSYDEKKFAQDPTGQDGGLDRMQKDLLNMRAKTYNDLLAHLFNTGQGIVTEKSPFSDYVFQEACYQMGWIDKTTRIYNNRVRRQVQNHLFRPNLIIHLDAPVDVVQARIRERAEKTHPWEKNSPVYNNTAYMTLLYEKMLKGDYMQKAAPYSRVLTYDWSEGGETEVVVEDIERLNMDYFDIHDKQQSDWRLHIEDAYSAYRTLFTKGIWINGATKNVDYLDADKILPTPDECMEFQQVAQKLPGNCSAYGYDEELGDKIPLLDIQTKTRKTPAFKIGLDKAFTSNQRYDSYWAERTRRRLAGEQNWWNF